MTARLTTINLTNAPVQAWDRDGTGRGPFTLAFSSTAPDAESASTPAGDVSYATTSIANGASLSSAVDLGNRRLARVIVPASFEGGYLQFQTSYDGTNYADFYDEYGTKLKYTAGSSTAVRFPIADWYGVRWVKFRSTDSGGSATNQSGAASLILATVGY